MCTFISVSYGRYVFTSDYNNHISFEGFHRPVDTVTITLTSKQGDDYSIANTKKDYICFSQGQIDNYQTNLLTYKRLPWSHFHRAYLWPQGRAARFTQLVIQIRSEWQQCLQCLHTAQETVHIWQRDAAQLEPVEKWFVCATHRMSHAVIHIHCKHTRWWQKIMQILFSCTVRRTIMQTYNQANDMSPLRELSLTQPLLSPQCRRIRYGKSSASQKMLFKARVPRSAPEQFEWIQIVLTWVERKTTVTLWRPSRNTYV